MRIHYVAFTAILLGLLILTSCGSPTLTPVPLPTALSVDDQVATVVAQTLEAEASLQPADLLPTPLPEGQLTLSPVPAEATPTALPTPTAAPCTNAAALVSESSTGAGQYSPGASFAKTWTVRNTGTCLWDTAYQLVFANGSAGQTTPPVSLLAPVQPQETVELAVNLSAPLVEGPYSGNWMLRAPEGTLFGLGEENAPFLVQLEVKTGASPPNTGTPAFSDSFDSNNGSWYLGADDNIRFQMADGQLELTAFKSAGDQWRVFERSVPGNLYVQASFRTGSTCSGQDSYGFFARTPVTPDLIYDSGYVFGVSCDGQYRFYSLNEGSFTSLVNWTASETILPGPNVTNQLGLELNRSTIRLYANNQLLVELTDSAHTGGQVGLMIRSAGTPDFQVFVEDFAYWTVE